MKKQDPLIRFWSKIKLYSNGCWLWTGNIDKWGYGRFSIARSVAEKSHKWIWELFNGSVEKGLHIHHICGVKHCVNPAHLEVVSPRDHIIRHPDHFIAKQISRTHCPKGHPYDYHDGHGRRCHICDAFNARMRRYRAA